MNYLSKIFLLLLFTSCSADLKFEYNKELDYPSGSGLSFINDKLYLIGDDAYQLVVLDKSFNFTDSTKLFNSAGNRIPKENKADIEAATIIINSKTPKILLIGSGSLAPYRNYGYMIEPLTKDTTQLNLNSFYNRLKKEGIDALNIEGVTSIPGGIVLANRGNRSFPANHLIFTGNDFWNKQESVVIKKVKIGINNDTASFNGISGLDYAKKSDKLLISVSTENTFSAIDDGEIGKSYLWIVNNISAKKNMGAINPNKIIDLDEMDKRFKGHKIESVCIIKEDKDVMQLVLVADNDKGKSNLFKITIKQ